MQLSIPRSWVRNVTRTATAIAMRPNSPMAIQRAGLDSIGAYLPLPKGIEQTAMTLASRPALHWKPTGQNPKHVVLYFHGGVYCIGSPKSHRNLCSHLAHYADRSVIALDYRLAPEHVYPAALDDVIAAYQALLQQGYKAKDIVVAGDSAGGGLSLACIQQLRERGIEQPAAAYLISPWIDLRNNAPSHQSKAAVDPVLSTEFLSTLRDHYLQETPNTDPTVSPLLGNMHDLCPILIQVGSEEILLDDSLNLAKAIEACGGQVTLEESPELWHVFQITPSLFADARIALQKAGNFINALPNSVVKETSL